MGIKTIKVLRTISKIVLLIIVLGLLGWGGYYVYRSIAFKPQNIVVTNITDSSATITWTTSSQMNGVVYYRKNKSVLPGPLGIIGSHIGYDDRDVSDAQTACVNEFNKNASETKDENFSVSGENFDCEDARVTGMGKYYTHSVTIKDLDPESTYYFSMGDGIWSFKSDVSSVETFSLLEEVAEPMPVFGRVIGDDGSYSRDALVYVTFKDGSEGKDSILYSSTTSDDGGWYVDASSIRDSSGNILPLELGNDTFRIKAKYSNYGESAEDNHVFGYFEVTTFDLVVTKSTNNMQSLLNKFVLSAYATSQSCPTCPSWMTEEQVQEIKDGKANCADIGYGNCLKVFAGDDKKLDETEAKEMEENGDSILNGELDYIAGAQNMSNYCNSKGEYCVVNSGCDSTPGHCGVPMGDGGDTCTPKTCTYANGGYKKCIAGSLKYFEGDDANCNNIADVDELAGDGGGNTCSTSGTDCSSSAHGSGTYFCSENNTYYYHSGITASDGRTCSSGQWVSPSNKCSIKAKYSTDLTVWWGKNCRALESCTLTCTGLAAQTISEASCKKAGVEGHLCEFEEAAAQEIEDIQTVTVDLAEMSNTQLRKLAENNAAVATYMKNYTKSLEEEYSSPTCSNYATQAEAEAYKAYCEARGGKIVKDDSTKVADCDGGTLYKLNCKVPGEQSFIKSLTSPVLAEETEEASESYALYLPELWVI
jgi:hypothetical protein